MISEISNELRATIRVAERIQAGGIFLFKFLCPACQSECLETYPFGNSSCCNHDLSVYEINIIGKRFLCGTERRNFRITKKMIRLLLEYSNGCCLYCEEMARSNYHVDHIRPIACGGSNHIDNLCLSCPKCNLLAGGKFFASFAAKKLYILKTKKKKS